MSVGRRRFSGAYSIFPQQSGRYPYYQYLLSPEWDAIRQACYAQAGYRCQLCNESGRQLNVHHRTYERRGCEEFADLIVLCRECHEIFHDRLPLADEEDEAEEERGLLDAVAETDAEAARRRKARLDALDASAMQGVAGQELRPPGVGEILEGGLSSNGPVMWSTT